MKKNRVRSWLPGLLVAFLLLAAMSAQAAQSTSETTVNAKLPPQMTIQKPDSIKIAYTKPPETATQDCSIVVSSNIPWKLSLKASNEGYMKSGKESLDKPLQVRYIEMHSDKAITLSDKYKLYRMGNMGYNDLPTRFLQQFSKSDKPGNYKINIYYKLEPNF